MAAVKQGDPRIPRYYAPSAVTARHGGAEVEVYFNLHKRVFSVRDRKTKLVIAHARCVPLIDVTTRVSEPGRLRVIREKRKNVHAFFVGTIPTSDQFQTAMRLSDDVACESITYNPYKYDQFVYQQNPERPFESAPFALLVATGKGPRCGTFHTDCPLPLKLPEII